MKCITISEFDQSFGEVSNNLRSQVNERMNKWMITNYNAQVLLTVMIKCLTNFMLQCKTK